MNYEVHMENLVIIDWYIQISISLALDLLVRIPIKQCVVSMKNFTIS